MNSQKALTSRRVLVVDDNADAALVLSMCLNAYGHQTVVAHSGPDSLKVAESFEPEVVLLDLGMPIMSGYEVAGALRQIPSLESVFIAALTGWNDAATRLQVIEAGFDRRLVKPAKVELVLEMLEQAA